MGNYFAAWHVRGVLKEKTMIGKNGECHNRRTMKVMSLGQDEAQKEKVEDDLGETPF